MERIKLEGISSAQVDAVPSLMRTAARETPKMHSRGARRPRRRFDHLKNWCYEVSEGKEEGERGERRGMR